MTTNTDTIRQLAYSLWECEGCPHGHDIDYWVQAENIVNQRAVSKMCTPHRSSGLTLFPVACASYMASNAPHTTPDQNTRSKTDIIKIIAAINRSNSQFTEDDEK